VNARQGSARASRHTAARRDQNAPGQARTEALQRGNGVADRLLNVREAAALLAVKPATLYQWAYQRRITVVKLHGNALRFRMSDLEQLIADSVRPALPRSRAA
jgi:excisionase family DNA binding protein